MDNWLMWLLLAVLVLAVLLAVWFFLRNQERNRARATAEELRERAAGGESYAEERESIARRAQSEAEEARLEADAARKRAARAEQEAAELDQQARGATEEAREHRDRVTDTYLKADEIDPDAEATADREAEVHAERHRADDQHPDGRHSDGRDGPDADPDARR